MDLNQHDFIQMYRRHQPYVAQYVRRRVAADVADDIVAETFLVAWRRLDSVPETPLPWLYGVARRTISNHRRTEQRSSQLHERLASQSTAEADLRLHESSRVRTALQALRDDDQEILRLIAWEGLSLQEVAEALSCSRTAAGVRLHRARKRLAKALDQEDDAASRPPKWLGGSELSPRVQTETTVTEVNR